MIRRVVEEPRCYRKTWNQQVQLFQEGMACRSPSMVPLLKKKHDEEHLKFAEHLEKPVKYGLVR